MTFYPSPRLTRSPNPFRHIKGRPNPYGNWLLQRDWQTQCWQFCTPRQVQVTATWYKLVIQNYLLQRNRLSPRSTPDSQLVQKQTKLKLHRASSLVNRFPCMVHLGLIMMWSISINLKENAYKFFRVIPSVFFFSFSLLYSFATKTKNNNKPSTILNCVLN